MHLIHFSKKKKQKTKKRDKPKHKAKNSWTTLKYWLERWSKSSIIVNDFRVHVNQKGWGCHKRYKLRLVGKKYTQYHTSINRLNRRAKAPKAPLHTSLLIWFSRIWTIKLPSFITCRWRESNNETFDHSWCRWMVKS